LTEGRISGQPAKALPGLAERSAEAEFLRRAHRIEDVLKGVAQLLITRIRILRAQRGPQYIGELLGPKIT
jgi:hypothetical protein